MLRITGRLDSTMKAPFSLTLSHEQRQKRRQRVTLDDGQQAALMLPHGTVLIPGDTLCAENGSLISVEAALEAVSRACSPDPMIFARICYHLGNRHVPLQIGEGWVRYHRDHVLDHMVLGLGGVIVEEQAQFEPEHGAYHHSHPQAHLETA